ncbi:hypothetical protein JAO76_07240 [Pontibacter sp. BT310]|uniref:Lipoprotein n=1 Tax=Pontibacter populi TaxID=890055 RepID=A0ABS6XA12_9BACT|nr:MULTISPECIES: hypothetical protein [Pontibacter]MBJ6117977.1 hypothetical protein [Pontibacter sp. BT310]MBR0570404.1 hypothetical protein [Microvirga sp. STS03]MBW3364830.1 hypothetical protein [Pontibacter populi]
MKKINSLLYLSVIVLAVACGSPESMKDFDSTTWKADKNACKGDRAKLAPEFEKIRKDMVGKKEYIVRNVLGKPDKEELLERSQRIYYYYLESGEQCQNTSTLSEASRLEVRINSLGKVSEVNYNQPQKLKKPE